MKSTVDKLCKNAIYIYILNKIKYYVLVSKSLVNYNNLVRLIQR